MSYLVLGFIPDKAERLKDLPITALSKGGGVHTPLRQDRHYMADLAIVVAELWRNNPVHPRERVVIVKIVDELPNEYRPGVSLTP